MEKWVTFSADVLPKDFDPAFFSKYAGVEFRREDSGQYRGTLLEYYRSLKPPRLSLELLARGNKFEAGAEKLVQALPSIDQGMSPEQRAMFRSAREYLHATSALEEPLWSRFVGETHLTEDSNLLSFLKDIQAKADNSLWVVSADFYLSMRLATVRAIFARRHTADAWKIGSNADGFPAARALLAGTTNAFQPFFTLPLLIQSPWIWGVCVDRVRASFVLLFDNPMPTRELASITPRDTFHSPMYASPAIPRRINQPQETSAQREEFLKWWINGASRLVHLLGDFTRYRDEDGLYSPSRQLSVVLSVERLFAISIEIMKNRASNPLLRKWLFFDFLDIIEGLGIGDIEKSASLNRRSESWSKLSSLLPTSVSEFFSGVIEPSLAALRSLDESMWVASRRKEGGVLIDRSDGKGAEIVSQDRLRGEYLRILRNSQHGFKKIFKNPRDLNYLASFTGEISSDLPDLIWCFLAEIMYDPELFLANTLRHT